jgi:2,4'-dihydroxyacetophenone dioxygenase
VPAYVVATEFAFSIFQSSKETHLPITAFSSFSDGLAPNQRSREHCIADIDLEDGPHWVPYANGVWIQLCHFNLTSGGFSVVLKGLPGAALGTHYYIGTVRGFTLRGRWRYLEHDRVAKPGTFIDEPPARPTRRSSRTTPRSRR